MCIIMLWMIQPGLVVFDFFDFRSHVGRTLGLAVLGASTLFLLKTIMDVSSTASLLDLFWGMCLKTTVNWVFGSRTESQEQYNHTIMRLCNLPCAQTHSTKPRMRCSGASVGCSDGHESWSQRSCTLGHVSLGFSCGLRLGERPVPQGSLVLLSLLRILPGSPRSCRSVDLALWDSAEHCRTTSNSRL